MPFRPHSCRAVGVDPRTMFGRMRSKTFLFIGVRIMVNTGKAIIAGLGARALTGGLIGFILVFVLIYWLLGGSR